MSKENEMLRQKFKMTKYQTLAELVRDKQSSLTVETWAAVILRGSTPALRTLIVMMVDLDCPREEIVDVLKARGESVIANLIADKGDRISRSTLKGSNVQENAQS